jgi:hypothetical protein
MVPEEPALLESLKILSVLKPGQKLGAGVSASTQLLIHEKSSTLFGSIGQSLTRFWRSDSRQQTLRVLYALFNTTFDAIEKAFSSMETGDPPISRTDRILRFRQEQLVVGLKRSVEEAQQGLKVLQQTYSEDVNFLCQLMLLEDHITSRLHEIEISFEYVFQKQDSIRQLPLRA